MGLHFTKQDLKQYSRTFSKGLAYYEEGAVGDIETAIDKYTAHVSGSQVYLVEYSPAENKFSCNCPVDGFCKHIVAFGLKLLDEKERLPDIKDFDKWYQSVNDNTKTAFLKRILSSDSRMKSKFEKYVAAMEEKQEQPEIGDIAREVYDILDSLSWEEALESYSYRDGYVEEYELVDALVEENLEDYNTKVLDLVSLGKIEDAFHFFLGTYLGISRASNTEIAEYCDYLEFPVSEARDKLFQAVGNLPQQRQKTILDSFIRFFESNKMEYLGYFDDLLVPLLKNDELKLQIKKFLDNYSADYSAKKLLMKIAEDDTDISLMQKLLKNSKDAGLFVPYLKILLKNGEFEKIKTVLQKFSGKRDICTLKSFVVPQIGEELYKELLLQLITHCFDLRYYKAYKKFAGNQEVEMFLDELSGNISYKNEQYAMPVLFYEKRVEPVLRFVDELALSEYGFDSYLGYLVEISKTKPAAVWEILKKRTDFFFKQRKRHSYRMMTEYLKTMLKIDRNKTSRLILDYYHHKPVLRALRDEFEKAELA
jgi:hypothetical protein